MGFRVEQDIVEGIPETEYRKAAHDALDKIITAMESGTGQTGGEVNMSGRCEAGHTHIHRLTFCDFTNEVPCVRCSGTGADPQVQPVGGH